MLNCRPTPEEIKQSTQLIKGDEQIVFIEEGEATSANLIEYLTVKIRNFAIKVFRMPAIKKVIFVVVMSLSALEGIQVYVPKEVERSSILSVYFDNSKWLENIITYKTAENQSRYYLIGLAANPSPVDENTEIVRSTIFAPVSGSANFGDNFNYQEYDPT